MLAKPSVPSNGRTRTRIATMHPCSPTDSPAANTLSETTGISSCNLSIILKPSALVSRSWTLTQHYLDRTLSAVERGGSLAVGSVHSRSLNPQVRPSPSVQLTIPVSESWEVKDLQFRVDGNIRLASILCPVSGPTRTSFRLDCCSDRFLR